MLVSQHIRGYTYNAGTEKRKEGSCNTNYGRRSDEHSYWRYSLFGRRPCNMSRYRTSSPCWRRAFTSYRCLWPCNLSCGSHCPSSRRKQIWNRIRWPNDQYADGAIWIRIHWKNRCSAYRWKRRNGITDTKSMPTIWSNPLCFSCWLCSNSRDGGGVRRWAFLGRTGHARNTLVVQGKRIRPANRFNRYIRKKPVWRE